MIRAAYPVSSATIEPPIEIEVDCVCGHAEADHVITECSCPTCAEAEHNICNMRHCPCINFKERQPDESDYTRDYDDAS